MTKKKHLQLFYWLKGPFYFPEHDETKRHERALNTIKSLCKQGRQ